jgi:hypothetical protein
MTMSLWSEFVDNQGLRTLKFDHYFPIYERHFSRFVNLDVTLYEIGVFQGGSLRSWKKFLGPGATIVGIDINPICTEAEEDQVLVRVGDQSDLRFLEGLIDEFGPPDIVIDDGSHLMSHICTSLEYLYPRMPKNAVYLVEDTHCSYWEEFGGGVGVRGAVLEHVKATIDAMHAQYSRGKIEATVLSRGTAAVHVYDSVVVLERGVVKPRLTVTGARQLFGEDLTNANIRGLFEKLVKREN